MSVVKQLLMFACVLVGVWLSDPVLQYVETGNVAWNITPVDFLIPAAIALVLVPTAFAALKPDALILVQIALMFQQGIFWRLVWGTIKTTFE